MLQLAEGFVLTATIGGKILAASVALPPQRCYPGHYVVCSKGPCFNSGTLMKLVRLVLPLFVLVVVPSVLASTINVPKDQPTIQAGINAANNGDTVLVAPGKYVENINFNGKAITVTSAKGPKVTVIDGNAVEPVVLFISNEGTNSILNGFTVENGAGGNYSAGGGISISQASPKLTNNVIENNTALDGGGVGVIEGSPVIAGNVIDGNSAQFGGGISVGGNSNAQILHNRISNNGSSFGGGGSELNGAANVLIEDNKILGNIAGIQGGGFWIVNEADEVIVQNLIANNWATSGSQVYSAVPQSSVGFRLINNTIVSATPASTFRTTPDAAIFADGFNSNVLIVNNIIFAPFDGAALLCNQTYNDGPPIVEYNDAFNTLGVSYGDSCAGMDGTQGNISGNPEFVNRGKIEYELRLSSPAINAGTTSAPDLPKKDLAGHPRIVNGKIDMGAYEHQGK